MKREIFAGVYLCRLAIFCVLRKLIFVIRTDWLSCWELTFAIFRKSLIIVSFFIEYVEWNYIFSNNTMVCISYVKPVEQITSLCHWITITPTVADCSDDRI